MPLLKSKIAAPAVEVPKQDTPTNAQMASQLAQVVVAKTAVKKAATSETMSKKEWADKDDRISRAGVWQACMHSVGLLQLNTGNTLEDYLALVEKAADAGYAYVHRQ
jgi:hypothetical protein